MESANALKFLNKVLVDHKHELIEAMKALCSSKLIVEWDLILSEDGTGLVPVVKLTDNTELCLRMLGISDLQDLSEK